MGTAVARNERLSPVANHAGRKDRPRLDNHPRIDRDLRGEACVNVPNGVDHRLVANVDMSANLYLVLVTCR